MNIWKNCAGPPKKKKLRVYCYQRHLCLMIFKGREDIRRVKKYVKDELEIIAAGVFESEEDVVNAVEAGADAVMVNESCKIVKA